MRITTTDGREYSIVENCPYCYPNTAGVHDITCPNYQPPVTTIKPSGSWHTIPNDFQLGVKCFIGTGFLKKGESYPDYVARRKQEIDAHPEWGIRYL